MSDVVNQADSLIDMVKTSPVQVISVTGGKGGVGKTSTSINIAVGLSEMGKKVLLFDADLGLSNVDVLLGLQPQNTIADVMNGNCSLEEIMIQGPAGIQIIPAASGIQKMADLTSFELSGLIQAFSELAQNVDVLLVDTAAGISNQVLSFIRACQENIVVVCDEPSSITDAYALIKVLNQRYKHRTFKILANMIRTQQEGENIFYKLKNATDRFLEINLQYIGSVPFDDNLRHAIQNRSAVIEAYPNSKSAMAYKRLTRRIADWPIANSPQGHISFFLERLVENSRELAYE